MPKSIGPKLFLGQSCFVTKCFQAKVCMGLKYSLVQSIFWSKVFSGPKYFLVQSILRSKGFSAPKYSLDRSIPWAEVCLRPKYVWGQSECGTKAVLGPTGCQPLERVTYFLLKQSLKSTFLVILVPMLIRGCVCTATTLFQYANGICYYCFSNVTDRYCIKVCPCAYPISY